jgi:hypothetical protein
LPVFIDIEPDETEICSRDGTHPTPRGQGFCL